MSHVRRKGAQEKRGTCYSYLRDAVAKRRKYIAYKLNRFSKVLYRRDVPSGRKTHGSRKKDCTFYVTLRRERKHACNTGLFHRVCSYEDSAEKKTLDGLCSVVFLFVFKRLVIRLVTIQRRNYICKMFATSMRFVLSNNGLIHCI